MWCACCRLYTSKVCLSDFFNSALICRHPQLPSLDVLPIAGHRKEGWNVWSWGSVNSMSMFSVASDLKISDAHFHLVKVPMVVVDAIAEYIWRCPCLSLRGPAFIYVRPSLWCCCYQLNHFGFIKACCVREEPHEDGGLDARSTAGCVVKKKLRIHNSCPLCRWVDAVTAEYIDDRRTE